MIEPPKQATADHQHQASDYQRRTPPGVTPQRPPRQGAGRRWQWWLLGALLILHGGLAGHGAWTDSQTTDEGVHLAAGVTYWATGDWRLNPEHPVLWKLIAAAPVMALRPTVNLTDPAWAAYQEWDFASRFLHDNRVPAVTMLRVARIPTVLASLALIVLVFLLGRRLRGPTVGVFAAALVALDPTMIAHGHYVTTDTAVTLGLIASLWSLHRLLELRTRWRWLALVASVLFTISVKYSGLIILAIIPLIVWWEHRRGRTTITGRRILLVMTGSMVIWLLLLYRGNVLSYNQDPRVAEIFRLREELITTKQVVRQPSLIQQLVSATGEGQPVREWIDRVGNVPLPFYWYWRGVAAVTSHAYWGQHAWLLGQTSERGWWWYFPVAIAVKFPAPTLVLLIGALCLLVWYRWQKQPWQLPSVFVVPLLVYTGFSVFSKLNLGVRHLMPLFPLLALLIATQWQRRWPQWNRLRQGLIVSCLLLLALTTISIHPKHIAHYSSFIGGTNQGHRFVLDSNIDWGQDYLRLGAVLKKMPNTRVGILPTGTADPTDYGVSADRIDGWTRDDVLEHYGLVAISLGRLMGEPEKYGWLREHSSMTRVGASILLYDLRQ